MSIFHIRTKNILPDTAFFSLVSTGQKNSIKYKKSYKNIDIPTENIFSTTFLSNSLVPKTYKTNVNNEEYNINYLSLNRQLNYKSTQITMSQNEKICDDPEECSSCLEYEKRQCLWYVDFDPVIKTYANQANDSIFNDFSIDAEDIGPINTPNNSIQFTATVNQSNSSFSIDIYIKTLKCNIKEFNFSGNSTLTESFETPDFDPNDDYIVEFYFIISTGDCVGIIAYEDLSIATTCTTTPTLTPTPTP